MAYGDSTKHLFAIEHQNGYDGRDDRLGRDGSCGNDNLNDGGVRTLGTGLVEVAFHADRALLSGPFHNRL